MKSVNSYTSNNIHIASIDTIRFNILYVKSERIKFLKFNENIDNNSIVKRLYNNRSINVYPTTHLASFNDKARSYININVGSPNKYDQCALRVTVHFNLFLRHMFNTNSVSIDEALKKLNFTVSKAVGFKVDFDRIKIKQVDLSYDYQMKHNPFYYIKALRDNYYPYHFPWIRDFNSLKDNEAAILNYFPGREKSSAFDFDLKANQRACIYNKSLKLGLDTFANVLRVELRAYKDDTRKNNKFHKIKSMQDVFNFDWFSYYKKYFSDRFFNRQFLETLNSSKDSGSNPKKNSVLPYNIIDSSSLNEELSNKALAEFKFEDSKKYKRYCENMLKKSFHKEYLDGVTGFDLAEEFYEKFKEVQPNIENGLPNPHLLYHHLDILNDTAA